MDATLCIKTFLRPDCLRRLLESIRQHARHDYPILIADDSGDGKYFPEEEADGARVVHLPYDVGLSRGRNALADLCETPYFVLLDDDFVFTPESDPEPLIAAVKAGLWDIVGGGLSLNGRQVHYEGTMQLVDRVLYMKHKKGNDRDPLSVDICFNWFACRTETVRRVRWRDSLKICEHMPFFLDCQRAGVSVGYLPTCVVDHQPSLPPGYREMRQQRINEFVKIMMAECQMDRIVGGVHR